MGRASGRPREPAKGGVMLGRLPGWVICGLIISSSVSAQNAPFNQAQFDRAVADSKRVLMVWVACQKQASAKLAVTSNEPAATIILATFAACGPEEDNYKKAVRAWGQGPAVAQDLLDATKNASKERLSLEIIGLRARQK